MDKKIPDDSSTSNHERFRIAGFRMVLEGRDAATDPNVTEALTVIMALEAMFSKPALTPADRLMLAKMRSAVCTDREPRTAEKRERYAVAVALVEDAATAVVPDDLRIIHASNLAINLAFRFDIRMQALNSRLPRVVELLERYDPKAGGNHDGKCGAVRILAHLIVLAGGFDKPINNAETWQRAITTALGRT